MTSILAILGTTIRQDAEGRFCLNDCHKAAGGDKAKQPANFLRLDTTKALIAEISRSSDVRNAPVNVKQGGNDQGSYACRELIYAYGEWISASFHLTVIRAFDALVTGDTSVQTPAIDLNDPAFLRQTLLGYTEKVIALQAENAVLAPKAEGFDRFANSIGRTNLREVGKALNIGSKRGIELLRELGWTFRTQSGRWNAYAKAIDAGNIEVKYHTFTNETGEEVSRSQVFVTPKGMANLALRLQQN